VLLKTFLLFVIFVDYFIFIFVSEIELMSGMTFVVFDEVRLTLMTDMTFVMFGEVKLITNTIMFCC
jgi:hypothetical protein